jgi:hypothetical protein
MTGRISQARQAIQFVAYVFKPAFGCCDPMSVRPRWIVPNMLLMTTLKHGNPVQFLIQVEPDNLSRKTLKLLLWLHDVLSGMGVPS